MSVARGLAYRLPARERSAVPWKNGGGITREVLAHPAGADLSHFDWRVSTAEVRSAGPFSAFTGIDRTLCVLEGELELTDADGTVRRLSGESEPWQFPGELAVEGRPVGKAVTDLNVMTRRARFTARVRRCRAPCLLMPQAETTLLFALAPLRCAGEGASIELALWDAAWLPPAARCQVSAAAAALFWLIELQATF